MRLSKDNDDDENFARNNGDEIYVGGKEEKKYKYKKFISVVCCFGVGILMNRNTQEVKEFVVDPTASEAKHRSDFTLQFFYNSTC